MKALIMLVSMMTFLSLNSPAQSKKVNRLLDKQETRTEIFNNILNNHELMMEFMQAMKGNEHAMMMMKSSSPMTGKSKDMGMNGDHPMMGNSNMMGSMKDNPEMMQKMMSNMMDQCQNDSVMCNKMADMMTDHPQMMKMCMQKMKEKGMMGTDGKMDMMKQENQSENNNQSGTNEKHDHQH